MIGFFLAFRIYIRGFLNFSFSIDNSREDADTLVGNFKCEMAISYCYKLFNTTEDKKVQSFMFKLRRKLLYSQRRARVLFFG